MKPSFLKNLGSLTVLTVAAHLPAAELDETSKNEFRLGPSFGCNFKATFRGFPASPLPPTPAAGPLVDRNYADGYVRVDSSGNAGNQTWNWGYHNNAQYDQAASTINLSHLAVNTEALPAQTDGRSYGFELSYLRRLGESPDGPFSVELAFGYNRLEISDNSSHSVSATVTTDSFPLGGVIPPFAPYAGTFSGPGALLGTVPTRAPAVPAAGSITGSRTTAADIYNFRLGPVFTLPVGEMVRLELAAGLAVSVVDNQFSFSETLAVNGITDTRSESGGGPDKLFGPYVRGGINLALAPSWRVFAGAQYQYLSNLIEQTANGETVTLDFRKAIYVTAQVSYSF